MYEEVDETNPYYRVVNGMPEPGSPYYLTARTPEQEIEDNTTAEMAAVVEQAEAGEGLDLNDVYMASRMFIDGLWWNKGDEIGTWPAAVAVKLLSPELAESKSVGEIRQEMITNLEAEAAEFTEENPVLSIGANIAGNILSPGSLAVGKGLQVVEKGRRSAQAARSGEATAAALPGVAAPAGTSNLALRGQMAGQEASRASSILPQRLAAALGRPTGMTGVPARAGEELFKLGARLPKGTAALPTAVAGAGIGAVAGYEGGNAEEKAKNATMSAMLGFGVPYLFKGAGLAWDGLTRNRLAQQLGKETADFVSLMYTDHGLAGVYKHVVSKTFGGRSFMEQQARALTGRVRSKSVEEAADMNIVKSARESLKAHKQNLQDDFTAAKERIRDELKDLQAATGDRRAALDRELADGVDGRIKELNQLLEEGTERIKYQSALDIDKNVNAANAAFRSRAISEALPSEAPAELVQDIQTLKPQDALRVLGEKWGSASDLPFKAAKAATFKVEPAAALNQRITKMLDNDLNAISLYNEGGAFRNAVQDALMRYEKSVKNGRISGADLVDLRSRIGQILNVVGENKGMVRKYVSDLQDHFDNIITGQLKGAARESFINDRSKYALFRTVENAIAGATGKGRTAQGAFDADDYIEAVKRSSGKFIAARGSGPLQREAQGIAALNAERAETIKTLANDQAKKLLRETKRGIAAERRALTVARRRAQDALDKVKREQTREAARMQKYERVTRDRLMAKVQARWNAEQTKLKTALDDVQGRIDALKVRSDELARLGPPGKVSIFEQLFASGLAASMLGFATGGSMAGAAVGGVFAGGVLAQRGTQRFLAGQTGAQQAAQRLGARVGAAGDAAAQRGFTMASAGAVAGSEQGRQRKLFTGKYRQTVMALPPSRQAAIWKGLKSRGQLDSLKAQDPDLYRRLKRAATE